MAILLNIYRYQGYAFRNAFCIYSGHYSCRCASSAQGRVGLSQDVQTVQEERSVSNDQGPSSSMAFNDSQLVFKHKTSWELIRALAVLNICSYDIVVDNSEKLMRLGQKLLGNRLFSSLMYSTFYKQFCGGNSRAEILECALRLQKAGIGTLLAVPLEEDVDDSCITDADRCDRNLEITLDCLNMAADVQASYPMMQIRMTALFPATLCVNLSKLCPKPNQNTDLLKATALTMETGQPLDIRGLSDTDREELHKGLARLKAIGELAVDKTLIVMVDAEYTCMNPALSLFTLAMMLNYNKHTAIVFNTYQNYLKGATERLRSDVELIEKCGVCFGAKLVRGAYMIKERRLAREQGYPDPVHDSFEDTSNMYHSSMEFMLSWISKHPDQTKIIIASHNHRTVELAVDGLKRYGIDPSSGSVFLGQLYGIADHISFLLGSHGYQVYKSVPIGSLSDTLPYLSRRAQENRAILHGVRQERELLRTATRARLRDSLRWGQRTR